MQRPDGPITPAFFAEMCKARDTLAMICMTHPKALVIFDRLEKEIAAAEIEMAMSPVERARAMLKLRQMEGRAA